MDKIIQHSIILTFNIFSTFKDVNVEILIVTNIETNLK